MNKLFEEDDNLPNQIDPDKDYYTELVGEGRKFKDEKALARAKAESDEFIKMKNKQFDQLSQDYLRLKADYDATAKLEEMLDKVRSSENREELPPNANKPGMDTSELKQFFKSELSSYEREKRSEENVKKARELARETLGSNWQSTLKNKMDDLELSEDETMAMMARSPKAFATAFGLQTKPQQQSFQAPPVSSGRPEFKPSGSNKERTWSYYQDLKKTNPQAWLDPKIQTQMYQDAQRLGETFADGDFGPLEAPRKGY